MALYNIKGLNTSISRWMIPVHRAGTYYRYIVLQQGFIEITQKKVDHINPPSTLALHNIKGLNTWISGWMIPVHRAGTYYRYIVVPQGFIEITQKKVDHTNPLFHASIV